MAKLSLSPAFIKDSLWVLRKRGLKALLLGQRAQLTAAHRHLLAELKRDFKHWHRLGARHGNLTKVDLVHKGRGTVYLLPDQLDDSQPGSLLALSSDTKITNGPDLWLYLSDSPDPRQSLGNYLNLGLLHGNRGGQVYRLKQPVAALKHYQTVVVYCKQFEVLFSYGRLR